MISKNHIYKKRNFKYTIILCSKYKRKILTDDVLLTLKEAIREVEKTHKIEALIANIYDNRCIEIEIQSSPYVAVDKIITQIKAKTAKKIKEGEKTSWVFSKVPSFWSAQELLLCSSENITISRKMEFINSIPTSNREKEKKKWEKFKSKIKEEFTNV